MSRAWRAAAFDSRPLSFTLRRPRAARSWLSRHAVVLTAVRLVTLLGLAEALAQESAAAPAGTARAKTQTRRAAAGGCAGEGGPCPPLASPGPGQDSAPRGLDVCSTRLPAALPGQARTMASAAILDVDGTLVDTNFHHAIAWYRAFRQHEVQLPDLAHPPRDRHGRRPHRHRARRRGGRAREGRGHPRGREGPLRAADPRGGAARGRARADRGPQAARQAGRPGQLGQARRDRALPRPARRPRPHRRLDHRRRRGGHQARARPGRGRDGEGRHRRGRAGRRLHLGRGVRQAGRRRDHRRAHRRLRRGRAARDGRRPGLPLDRGAAPGPGQHAASSPRRWRSIAA